MSFTMSGVEGGWDFNRFDSLSEGKDKKKCDKCKGKGCSHCKGSGYMMPDRDDEGEGEGGDGGGAMGESVETVTEGRKPGESPKEYAARVTKGYKKGKSKVYDPMKDPDFDHDKAERTRGSMDEGLDPVGKEDADVNNNGKKGDSSDKYLLKRRAAIAKAMKKEEAELEMFTDQELDLLEDLLGK